MTVITSTSGRLHSEFIRILFLQDHRETDRFFTVSGVLSVQSDRRFFHYLRTTFSSMFKSRVRNILTKVEGLRIDLNLDGTPIVSKSHTHPSHSQTSCLLTSSLSLGVPVPRPTHVWEVCRFLIFSFWRRRSYRDTSLLVLDLTDKYPHDSLVTHILDCVAQFLPSLFCPCTHRGRVRQITSNVKHFTTSLCSGDPVPMTCHQKVTVLEESLWILEINVTCVSWIILWKKRGGKCIVWCCVSINTSSPQEVWTLEDHTEMSFPRRWAILLGEEGGGCGNGGRGATTSQIRE